jgi:predicted acyltransferase
LYLQWTSVRHLDRLSGVAVEARTAARIQAYRPSTVAPAPGATRRLSSLDVFRGATIAGMVIVNNPGNWAAMYWPLEHAEWNGWTPTDLIFPFFLFIVGVSITLSSRTLKSSAWAIAGRAAIIIGCGLFMAGFPFFRPGHWRIPGVLFRIGLCYLAAALLYRWTRGRRQAVILCAAVVATLAGYWFTLTRFGDLSPEGNIGAAIDRAIFGHHLWRAQWDPEGLLSTVPAVATTILGVLAGEWLRTTRGIVAKIMWMAGVGFALFVAGEIWGTFFPINKQLWTSSYVLLTAGGAAVLLAVCMHVIEVRRITWWTRPFVALGRNALTVFVVSGLVGKLLIIVKVGGDSLQTVVYERGFAWIGSPENASLVFSVVFLVLMFWLCDVMQRRGIFIRA